MEFQNINLNGAEVIDHELNPFSYDPDKYPSIEDVVEKLLLTSSKDPVQINLKDLSVNGRVAADRMDKYLSVQSNSSSALKEVLKNPASYYFYINDRANFEEQRKEHFELGTFCHSAFLEPDKFDKVVVEPEASRASIEGCNTLVQFWERLIWDKYTYKGVADKRLNEAMQIVDEAGLDVKKLAGMKYYIDALKYVSGYTAIKEQHKLIIDLVKRNYYRYGNGVIPMLLKGATFETSFYGTDPDTKLKVKVRPDAFNIEENIGVNAVISFKTTSAGDLSKFVYDAAKFRYSLSEGFYQNTISGITGRDFNVTLMVVMQTVAPYQVAVVQFQPEDLENGKYQARFAMDLINECNQTGLWPGFESLAERGNLGIIGIELPEWDKKLLRAVDLED